MTLATGRSWQWTSEPAKPKTLLLSVVGFVYFFGVRICYMEVILPEKQYGLVSYFLELYRGNSWGVTEEGRREWHWLPPLIFCRRCLVCLVPGVSFPSRGLSVLDFWLLPILIKIWNIYNFKGKTISRSILLNLIYGSRFKTKRKKKIKWDVSTFSLFTLNETDGAEKKGSSNSSP